jgi:hypothetical protein
VLTSVAAPGGADYFLWSVFLLKKHFWEGLSTPVFLAIIAVAILMSVSTLGLLTISQTISSSGTVIIVSSPNLGVFSDSQCTQTLSSFDWGSIEPGASVTKTIYIKNTGDVQLTLAMVSSGWGPSAAENFMDLTWNREDYALAVGQTTAAVLTLTVDSDINDITVFNVDIVISGTG